MDSPLDYYYALLLRVVCRTDTAPVRLYNLTGENECLEVYIVLFIYLFCPFICSRHLHVPTHAVWPVLGTPLVEPAAGTATARHVI